MSQNVLITLFAGMQGIGTLASCLIAVWAILQTRAQSKIIRQADADRHAFEFAMKQLRIEQDEKFTDLMQALSIATLISGPTSYGGFHTAYEKFKEYYSGKTPISKREK